MLRLWSALLCCLVFLAVLAAPGSAAQPHRWVFLSDLHFDPMADGRLVNKLSAAPVERWRDILASNGMEPYSSYGSDTNFSLLESTLEAVRNDVETPDAVIVTGDFIAHDFREKFNKAASHHDDAAFQTFVDKTVAFLAIELRTAFPRSAVYPVIGNNDGYCGDYASTPDSPFLAHMAAAFAAGMGMDSVTRAAFVSGFSHGGYYTVDGPIPHIRIIALNDVFLSAKYQNQCGDGKADPGSEEMTWFSAQLKALPQDRNVWVLAHEPPGVDVYSTLHDSHGNVVPFLADRFNDSYVSTLQDPASRVARVWSGHTHMNDFRLLRGAGSTYAVPLQMIPSVSPIFSNNPSFMVAEFDTVTGAMIGEQTFVLDDLAALAKDGNRPARWRKEFDFAQVYGLGGPDANGFSRLHDAMFFNSVSFKRFASYYDGGSGRVPIAEQDWRAYWCGEVALSSAAFRGCASPQIQASLPPQPTAPPVRTKPSPTPR